MERWSWHLQSNRLIIYSPHIESKIIKKRIEKGVAYVSTLATPFSCFSELFS